MPKLYLNLSFYSMYRHVPNIFIQVRVARDHQLQQQPMQEVLSSHQRTTPWCTSAQVKEKKKRRTHDAEALVKYVYTQPPLHQLDNM